MDASWLALVETRFAAELTRLEGARAELDAFAFAVDHKKCAGAGNFGHDHVDGIRANVD
jgi:hypothetical protein